MNLIIKALLFIVVSATWGTTWLAMKIAGETIPPLFATGMRFLFATPLLLLFCRVTKSPLLFPSGQRQFQVIISILYFSIPFTLMLYGETYVSSGLASVIFATMPVAVLITSMVLLNKKTNRLQLTGLALSTLSLCMILLNESDDSQGGSLIGILALMLAVAIHAVIYTQCKKRCQKIPVLTFNTLPCFGAGVLLFIIGALAERPMLSNFSLSSLLSTLYLGAFAGVFGILSYFFLQQRATPFQASIVFLVFPLIAVTLESALYGKSLSLASLYVMVPLAAGIFITLIGDGQCEQKKSLRTSH